MSYNYETVLVEKKESHALVTLNRPDKFNAANARSRSTARSSSRRSGG